MDQARILLAIVLSFLVFFLWSVFFVEAPPPTNQKAETVEKEARVKNDEALSSDLQESQADQKETVERRADISKTSYTASRTVVVDTPLYTAEINEHDASIQQVTLKKFRTTSDPQSPSLEVLPGKASFGTGAMQSRSGLFANLKESVFLHQADTLSYALDKQSRKIEFRWEDNQGHVVVKRFSFDPESYVIGMDVLIKNGSTRDLSDQMVISLFKNSSSNERQFGFEGPSTFVNNKLVQIEDKEIKEKPSFSGAIQWTALQDRYFMNSLVNRNVESGEAQLKINKSAEQILEAQFISPPVGLNSGEEKSLEYLLFIGPKSLQLLNSVGYKLAKAVDFGWFDIIAKPCVYILNFIYDYIPNYGIAIIILTILTKIILWPLANKSYRSMAEMKKIQPLVTELREKYKGDKKKMNEEMMALYRTYKVNPLGGCLPMVMQIPIFIALYRMLYETIELRHAPFFGWINDLSAPDRLFRFDFSIPGMQEPYGIPVLTLVMGATMFLQQKMSPPAGDPTQAKIMLFMPIIFTVIFINFSSGLVLYWLINNILSIGQQYYIQKKSLG